MTLRSHLVRSRCRSCLLGVAVGDALGAAVEFTTRPAILERYGQSGLDTFQPWTNDAGMRLSGGAITDDTQMTIATAAGLLDALATWRSRGVEDTSDAVWRRYRAWLETQSDPAQRRFPGATCLSALEGGTPGDIDDPVNDSKGSGGAMRIAPVGIAYQPDRAFEIGVECAALTHGHASGYLAAGFLADVVSRLVRGTGSGAREWSAQRGGPIPGAVAAAREVLLGWDDHDEVLERVDLAVELYMAETPLDEGFALLGEGWVAEEALGIALFAALNFPYDFDEGVLAAVNITGDSDTTGSMTGAVLGAALGEPAIRPEWASGVEGSAMVTCLADELYSGFIADESADASRCLD